MVNLSVSNPFDFFGLEVNYDLNLEELRQKYFDRQMHYHPDRFTTQSKEEQIKAEEISAALNKAYEVLQHPVLRAKAILEIKHNAPLEDTVLQDPVQLGEMMEWQEHLAATEIPKELNELKEKIILEFKQTQELFKSSLNQEDYFKLRYLFKIMEDIKKKQQSLSVKRYI
ncbi:MAG: Fe-S protein assembly co-chaperone HscB [Proteobacteria bacterium]|nr:Fe-S protein assembly co-chaperone HscB [Pseudomonadota bacterium]